MPVQVRHLIAEQLVVELVRPMRTILDGSRPANTISSTMSAWRLVVGEDATEFGGVRARYQHWQ